MSQFSINPPDPNQKPTTYRVNTNIAPCPVDPMIPEDSHLGDVRPYGGGRSSVFESMVGDTPVYQAFETGEAEAESAQPLDLESTGAPMGIKAPIPNQQTTPTAAPLWQGGQMPASHSRTEETVPQPSSGVFG